MSENPRIKRCIEDALAVANAEHGEEMSSHLVAALNAFADLTDTNSAGIVQLLAPGLQSLASPSGIGNSRYGSAPSSKEVPILLTPWILSLRPSCT